MKENVAIPLDKNNNNSVNTGTSTNIESDGVSAAENSNTKSSYIK